MIQATLPTAEQVREAVERTYARPALAPRDPGALDDLRRWLREQLARLFDRLPDLDGANPAVRWIVTGVLLVLGVTVIGWLLYNVFTRLQEPGDARARGRARAPSAGALPRGAGEWEEDARVAAAAGRFRDAALALYQALLLRLEHAGALRYDAAKTPGEYRREASGHATARSALGAFLRGFEPVAFGGRDLDAAGYDRLRAAAAEGGTRA